VVGFVEDGLEGTRMDGWECGMEMDLIIISSPMVMGCSLQRLLPDTTQIPPCPPCHVIERPPTATLNLELFYSRHHSPP
jgi:hypothetical protein